MPNPDSNARIEALLAAMTLGEKIGQMTLVSAGAAVTGPGGPVDHLLAVRSGAVGAICNLWGAEQTQKLQRVAVEETRLGIPVLFTMDVIHGHRTIFPVPLAEVGAFDPGLWERTARTAAAEAAADGVAMTYAPMLDVARDPRWGRIVESPGEDPWVAARYAHAKIRGFQGQDLAATDSLAATAKHVAAYGAVIAGREYAPVDVSERSLHEIYLPPFEEAVEAGVAGIMPAFHNLAGMPMTANRAVLRDLVRGRWGFEGVNVSDYAAIAELVVHGVAADLEEAAALALRAGVDLDLMGNAYASGLPGALERGLVMLADVDAAVRRILTLKGALGLFDDPYGRGRGLTSEQLAAHRALAREAARRAIVLLTNRGNVLPLTRSGGRIALLGPLADASADMLGSWAADGRPEEAVNILKGLRATFPEREVAHAPGAGIDGDNTGGIAAALNLARAAEVVVLCLGEARALRRGSSIEGGSIRHEAHGRLEQACGGGTRANMDLEGAGLEASRKVGPEKPQIVGRQLEADRPACAAVERELGHAPELEQRPGDARHRIADEQERRLLSRNVALVRHLDFDREQFTWPKLRGMRTQVAIGKARVGEPVAERELRINGEVDVLGAVVLGRASWPPARPLGVEDRDLANVDGPGDRQPGAGVMLAAEDVADRMPGLAAEEPGGEHGIGALEEPRHHERTARGQAHDHRLAEVEHRHRELGLTPRKIGASAARRLPAHGQHVGDVLDGRQEVGPDRGALVVEGDLVADRDLELVVRHALDRRLLRGALSLERLLQLRLLPVERVADPAAEGGADGRPDQRPAHVVLVDHRSGGTTRDRAERGTDGGASAGRR